eukprot:15472252-Alexandrium_andersonii.AAC.1
MLNRDISNPILAYSTLRVASPHRTTVPCLILARGRRQSRRMAHQQLNSRSATRRLPRANARATIISELRAQ